ncbi:T9SS type A sorting domain-containing protein [Lewinella sp. LCG006]|uniref:T9SS type A sorting domain-containing protein n=1 Tax=Lewinella sp. LCG006 TaxID=3231911 RepID=UPI003460886D
MKYLFIWLFLFLVQECFITSPTILAQNTTICYGDPLSDSYWNGFGNYTTANCNFELINGGLASMTTQFFPLETGSALITVPVVGRNLESTGIGLDRMIISFIVQEGDDYSVEIIGNYEGEAITFEAIGSGVTIIVSFQNNASGDIHTLGPVSIIGTTVLPVDIISFEANSQGTGILLEWVTSIEVDLKGFLIQRSTDVESWKDIGIVNSNGSNTTEKIKYTFTDKSPFFGNNYYRLKLVDKDQSFDFTHIIAATWTGSKRLIYPNPAKEYLTITPFENTSNCTYSIIDSKGVLIETKQLNGDEQKINISHLNPGFYRIRLLTNWYPFIKV